MQGENLEATQWLSSKNASKRKKKIQLILYSLTIIYENINAMNQGIRPGIQDAGGYHGGRWCTATYIQG